MRIKKCRGCGERYAKEPDHPPFRNWCSIDCAIAISREKARKAQRKKDLAWKQENKNRRQWLKEAQAAFNKYIRLRDLAAGHGCISCDAIGMENIPGGSYDCGHFLSVGAHPELRFCEWNAFLQCKKCNRYMAGNIGSYRKRIVHRIGREKLAWLEGPHMAQKYTIDDLKGIKKYYTGQARDLLKRETVL